MSESAEMYDIKLTRLKEREPAHTAAQATDQATTDAYALVAESVLTTVRHNSIRYVVTETGGANAVDVKLVGRVKDAAGNYSAWQDLAGTDAAKAGLAAGAGIVLYPTVIAYDEVGVMIKSNTAGSQGAVNVKGMSRLLPPTT